MKKIKDLFTQDQIDLYKITFHYDLYGHVKWYYRNGKLVVDHMDLNWHEN